MYVMRQYAHHIINQSLCSARIHGHRGGVRGWVIPLIIQVLLPFIALATPLLFRFLEEIDCTEEPPYFDCFEIKGIFA